MKILYTSGDRLEMGSEDWGQSSPSFPGFDVSLEQIIEKTSRLVKFLSERAQAKIEYSKRLKEISQKHQQKYNQINAKDKTRRKEQTTSAAFISILGQTLAAANREEQSSKTLLNLINSTLAKNEKISTEKRAKINNENHRLKQQLQEQQRRVQNAKNEHIKRKKEYEKAHLNYQKVIEKSDGTIQEQDRLRVASSDKEALAQRSKDELDRQTALFEKQNSTFYDEELPNLCRTQQKCFKDLIDVWKGSLKEVVKLEIDSVSESNKANLGLLHDVDKIDRSRDSNTIFYSFQSSSHRSPPTVYTNNVDYGSPQSNNSSSSATLMKSLGNMSMGLGKKSTPSESSYESRPKSTSTEAINFEKLRKLDSSRKPRIIMKHIDEQKELIDRETRKQEGLKRVAQASLDNATTKEVQQQLIESSMALKQATRNLEKLKLLLPRSRHDERSRHQRRTPTPRLDKRATSRDHKKRRETTGGIEVSWNRPGTSKHSRLGVLSMDANNIIDAFEQNSPESEAGDVRQQPDGLSDENESEWDEVSVLETFARGQVLFDFEGNIPDMECLEVKTDEVIEVSLRDEGGWTLARRCESSQEQGSAKVGPCPIFCTETDFPNSPCPNCLGNSHGMFTCPSLNARCR